jgi:hypothetical protein
MKNFSKLYCNVLNHVLILVNLLEKVLMGILYCMTCIRRSIWYKRKHFHAIGQKQLNEYQRLPNYQIPQENRQPIVFGAKNGYLKNICDV